MTHPPSDSGETVLPFDGDPVGRELRELFLSTTPEEPGSAEWDRVRSAALRQSPRKGPSWRVIGVAAAAAVLLAVGGALLITANRSGGPAAAIASAPIVEPEVSDEILPVAADDDVEIHSIRGGSWKVAVGERPAPERIDWAGPKDVWFWGVPMSDILDPM